MFSAEILNDPNVLFHGTSLESAQLIASEGLAWRPDSYDADEICKILAVFEAIDWCGEDRNGWLALSAFSSKFDFRDGPSKPVFLAEGDHRARMYAQKDFAGGESASGIRRALGDLRLLSVDLGAYARYREWLLRSRSQIVPPTQSEIAMLLEQFCDLEYRCNAHWTRFTAGAVIALRIEDEDLDSMEYHGMHGVLCYQRLLPERIIGIDSVELVNEYDFLADTPSRRDLPSWTGVVAKLLARDRAV